MSINTDAAKRQVLQLGIYNQKNEALCLSYEYNNCPKDIDHYFLKNS